MAVGNHQHADDDTAGKADSTLGLGLGNNQTGVIAKTDKAIELIQQEIAKRVFHITARHECRHNFSLNSIKESWPELELPGAHSDIGGGYNPVEHEYWFLTRPEIGGHSSW